MVPGLSPADTGYVVTVAMVQLMRRYICLYVELTVVA